MPRKYPKIVQMGSKNTRDMGVDGIRIDEKVDGSCLIMSRGFYGKMEFFNKKGQPAPSLFNKPIEYLKSMERHIPAGYTYFMEILNKPKHNQICYDRVPKNGIYLFDVYDQISEAYFPMGEDVDAMARDYLDVSGPNVLFETVFAISYSEVVEHAQAFIGEESFLGGHAIEGVVIKDYSLSHYNGKLEWPLTVAKIVSDEFREVMGQKHQKVKADPFREFFKTFCTEARWNKAVQHLEEEGSLLYEDSDIGSIIKEVHMDIEEEELEYIQKQLMNIAMKPLKKTAVEGLAHWYKDKLVNREIG